MPSQDETSRFGHTFRVFPMLNNTGDCEKKTDIRDRDVDYAREKRACFRLRDKKPREQRINLAQMTVAFAVLCGGLMTGLLLFCFEKTLMACKEVQ